MLSLLKENRHVIRAEICMDEKGFLQDIQENLEEVSRHESALGKYLWNELIKMHPADIARFLTDLERDQAQQLFVQMPHDLRLPVFEELTTKMQVHMLSVLDEQAKIDALNRLPAEALTDIFDILSDEDLKKYLELLHKKSRERVLALMQFHPESAGGIMDVEVISLRQEFTVEKCVSILQRLRPSRDIYQEIYVTNNENQLVGFIKLEDLVLHHPQTSISSFVRKNEIVAEAHEDREVIAQKMVHYSLMSIPVVDNQDHLLGVIPSDTLVDVLVEEAGEDVQKMSALAPLKYPYFETSFVKLLFERSYILLALLLAQSFSTSIMRAYESTLKFGVLLYFTTMLISTGGNASSQTSAVILQGMASGDINPSNWKRFIKREMLMACMLAIILSVAAFIRGVLTPPTSYLESFAISASLALIVMVSVTIGSCIPIILKRLNIDPAFAAGPFLATLMDILGILIFCMVARLILP